MIARCACSPIWMKPSAKRPSVLVRVAICGSTATFRSACATLCRWLPQFLAQNPEITLDLVFSDTVVDLMQERADVAIRVGPLRNSVLIARKLGSSRMAVVATPDYLAKSGTPANPGDLAMHKGGRLDLRPHARRMAVPVRNGNR